MPLTMSYNSINKNIFTKFLYSIIGIIIFLEFFFQIVFFADIKFFKKPILFFNPYCDQSYWNHVEESSFNKDVFKYHPTLTLIKKNNELAYNFTDNNYPSPKKNDLIFYGSSFIDHKYFIPHFEDKMNYAVKSYGLDQIFISYNLTKDQHPDDMIVFGFLLEDLDRVIFEKRNYPKIKFNKFGDTYKLTNVPIKLDNKENKKIDFYSYNLIKNLSFLTFNDYDYRRSECKIDFKKNLFKFFINEIINNSKELNQKIIFVTFNFQDDILESNWRYSFIKNYLSSKNIIHLDTKEILRKHMKKNNLQSKNYYSKEDFHLNELGNKIIINELNTLIEQYR